MISEGLQKLESMVVNGRRLVKLYETPRLTAYDEGGEEICYAKEPKPRLLSVDTIESLRTALEKWGQGSDSSVWVSFEEVVAVLNDEACGYRDNNITMTLTPSPYFGVLDVMQRPVIQSVFVDLLRHSLAGAVIGPENLLAIVRNLKFAQSSETTGKITNTSAAMGKTALAEVTGEAKLPELVTIEFEAYPSLSAELDSTVVVSCSLFVSAETQTLRLVPLPGEIDRVKVVARTAIATALELGDTPVLIGSP